MADQTAILIPNLDTRASLGLAGAVDSIGYRVAEIETHLHSSVLCYGITANNLARGSLTGFILSSGNAAYGAETQIHDGTVIESGSTIKKFDMNTLFITSVGTANRLTLVEFYYGTQAAGVVCTFTNATNKVNKVAHGLINGTKIMFSNSGGGLPAELNNYTTYYVINKADNDFEVSLTLAGGAIDITGDGTGTNYYHTLTQTLFSEVYLSFSATDADAFPFEFRSPRIFCNQRVWLRGKSAAGTNTVTMLFGLHTYAA